MRSVPPRGGGGFGYRHANSRVFRRQPVEPTRYRVVVLTSCRVDDRVLRQSGLPRNVFVKDVALLRDETGFGDQVAQHLLVGAIVSASGGDDVLFDHDRAHIVSAKAQRYLPETQTLRQPRRLKVFDVVEEQTRHRQHLQIIHTSRFVFYLPPERGVLTLKSPRNERGEAAGFIL